MKSTKLIKRLIECQEGALPFNFPVDLKGKQHREKQRNIAIEIIYWLKFAFPCEIQMQNIKRTFSTISNSGKHKFRNKNMHAKLKN